LEGFHISDAALFDHRFWLQIMGDHSRFIFYSLAPTESMYIQKAQDFIILFDKLLEEAHKIDSLSEIQELNRKAYDLTAQLKSFKLDLLSLTLESGLKVHLSSSFFNDMLNELEEYQNVMSFLMHGETLLSHPIHYHILWLNDAVGHAASVTANLDFIEKDMINKADHFRKDFLQLYLKAFIMSGYLRTQLDNFPALDRLNDQAQLIMYDFMEFLDYLRDQRISGRILGTLMPLMADHMNREECYYLWKLHQVTGTVKRPDCDPTRPRIET
jgi:hypothetical protein